MAAKDWDATQYLKFERERTRPALDLLSQVPLTGPKRILDLGCGPGNSTAVLLDRFPGAQIIGIDSSPDMLEKARRSLPGLDFRLGDLTSFSHTEDAELLFSNAVFQWLPSDQRLRIFSDLIQSQKPGGVFAFQVPDNMSEPTHVAMRSVAADGPWSETLRQHAPARKPFQSPQEIYDHLKPLCSDVNIWHTYYYHMLDDHQAIVEWVKGTGLRPFIDPLSPTEREGFLAAYLRRIEELYPPLHDGKVCLRYPRLFVVTVRA
ncbi:trans-aconitate 2-methyltransferase [Capronia epimyces CBS 606.96]|uniref:Trans-aconitate 2-methyltransferase n=1 Tax=Capronia epimyces CBS 606.96 TaxID=1182542 RepID=W9XPM0_9EURO|nr:trans-aconitate 2-methyltransferase [Capronia epimyces CBS 606.96]EXJ82482.1 trans-aconitate 2-methyltransferase [Capronia epimyces CBS 606.96]